VGEALPCANELALEVFRARARGVRRARSEAQHVLVRRGKGGSVCTLVGDGHCGGGAVELKTRGIRIVRVAVVVAT